MAPRGPIGSSAQLTPSNNNSRLSFVHVLFILVLLWNTTPGCNSLKVVSLNVPARVRKGTDLELVCLYDLGNATLYSLKWFYRTHEWDRDEQEFFRYTPRVKPNKQVFPLDGIQVDIDRSGGGSVYLRETGSKASGKYKCEISVEGTFQTVAAEKMMSVVSSSAQSSRIHQNELHLPVLLGALFWLLSSLFPSTRLIISS